jgi:hypothetical protein
MDAPSDQKPLEVAKTVMATQDCVIKTPDAVPALSAEQIMSRYGVTNILQGRTIRLNLFAKKT